MSEIVAGLKSAPGEFKHHPWMAIGVGFLFLLMVLIAEAFKPGLVTGPIRALLHAVGLKSA